ncbi:MAG: type I restriction-modification system subunit M N-terminal domain-containing protein, partial [Terrimesophilobacter sp.]
MPRETSNGALLPQSSNFDYSPLRPSLSEAFKIQFRPESEYVTPDRITLPELEQYLAKAADILRGSIDQADFKAYIFPLMFFKRISDVYLEEFADALEESGGDHEFASFAENHRFDIPEGNL